MAVSLDTVKSSKILVVDDNPSNVMLLETMLAQEGYENIHTTTNPDEVYPLDDEYDFDLILLDIQMPRMSGFEVMEQLQKNHNDDNYLPVLVLTAHTDMQTRLRSLDLGARDFISKPFQHAEVLQRIHNSLEIRHLYKKQKNQKLHLEQEVQSATKELRSTQLDVIRCLGRAGEYRDNETGQHVIRMSKFCYLLALEIGLSAKEADDILHASPMHDMGKLAIPDEILLKPGKLTPEEWDIMKTHAEIGSKIMSTDQSDVIRLAKIIALTHHERWDGTGYPRGLKGKDIPLEGRITAICDVFDALTSERSYKQAWPVEKAIDYINEHSGSHFDPELVKHFNIIADNLIEVRKQHMDQSLPESNHEK